MRILKSLRRGALAIALAASASSMALAEEEDGASMRAWTEQANMIVSKAMVTPSTRYALAATWHAIDLVIGRDGTILEASLVRSGGGASLRRASKSAINRLGRLPALPATVAGEKFHIRVNLIYAALPGGIDRMKKAIMRKQNRAGSKNISLAVGETPAITLTAAH